MHQSLQGATFHLEHIIPRVLGGSSDSSNLALAYPICNLHKADRTSASNSSNVEVIPFFNPRLDDWDAHFYWDDYTLIAKSEIGRLLANIWLMQHDQPVTIWPATDLRDTESPIRGEYIAAMKQADLRNYGPLIDLHKRFSE